MTISIPKGLLLAAGAFVLATSAKPAAAQIALEPEIAVATANVHLRAGPGTNYASLGILLEGTEVLVLGCFEERPWCEVEALGRQGFVSALHLGLIDAPVPVAHRTVLVPRYYDSFVHIAPRVILVHKSRISKPRLRRHVERPRIRRHVERSRIRGHVERPRIRRHVELPRIRRHVERSRIRGHVERPQIRHHVERPRIRRHAERAEPRRQAWQSRQSWQRAYRGRSGGSRAHASRRSGGSQMWEERRRRR